MCVGVLDHPVLADEPLAAGLTRERLLAGVEAHVAPQVGLVVELLRADVALVGLVAAVLRHVLLENEEREKGWSKTGSCSVSGFWALEFRHELYLIRMQFLKDDPLVRSLSLFFIRR